MSFENLKKPTTPKHPLAVARSFSSEPRALKIFLVLFNSRTQYEEDVAWQEGIHFKFEIDLFQLEILVLNDIWHKHKQSLLLFLKKVQHYIFLTEFRDYFHCQYHSTDAYFHSLECLVFPGVKYSGVFINWLAKQHKYLIMTSCWAPAPTSSLHFKIVLSIQGKRNQKFLYKCRTHLEK